MIINHIYTLGIWFGFSLFTRIVNATLSMRTPYGYDLASKIIESSNPLPKLVTMNDSIGWAQTRIYSCPPFSFLLTKLWSCPDVKLKLILAISDTRTGPRTFAMWHQHTNTKIRTVLPWFSFFFVHNATYIDYEHELNQDQVYILFFLFIFHYICFFCLIVG